MGGNKDTDQKGIKSAYADVYASMDTKNQTNVGGPAVNPDTKKSWLEKYGATSPDNVLKKLEDAQKAYTEDSLKKNNTTVRDNVAQNKTMAMGWMDARIDQLRADIKELKTQLGQATTTPKEGEEAPPPKLLTLPVVDENGIEVSPDRLTIDPSTYLSSTDAKSRVIDINRHQNTETAS